MIVPAITKRKLVQGAKFLSRNRSERRKGWRTRHVGLNGRRNPKILIRLRWLLVSRQTSEGKNHRA